MRELHAIDLDGEMHWLESYSGCTCKRVYLPPTPLGLLKAN